MLGIISFLGFTSGQTLQDNVSGTVDKESTVTSSSRGLEVMELQVKTEFINDAEVSPAVLYEGAHVGESKPEVDTSFQYFMTVKQNKNISGAKIFLKDDTTIEASLQNIDGQETSRYLQENELVVGRKKQKHTKNTKSITLKDTKRNKKNKNKSKSISLSSPTSDLVSSQTYTPVKSNPLSSPHPNRCPYQIHRKANFEFF